MCSSHVLFPCALLIVRYDFVDTTFSEKASQSLPPPLRLKKRYGPGHFGHIQLPFPVVNPLFVGLLVSILNVVCMNCHRLRISPHYIQAVFTGKGRLLHRLKSIGTMCSTLFFVLLFAHKTSFEKEPCCCALDSYTVSFAACRVFCVYHKGPYTRPGAAVQATGHIGRGAPFCFDCDESIHHGPRSPHLCEPGSPSGD